MKKYHWVLALLCLWLIVSCSKKDIVLPDEKKDPDYPINPAIPVTISDFTPANAKVGELITINGNSFGTDGSKVFVQFGNSQFTVAKTVTNTKVTVEVPSDATSGQLSIKVAANSAVNATGSFTLTVSPPPAPIIVAVSGFTPQSGLAGQEVTITGNNFGTDANAVKVRFSNGTVVPVKSVTATQLVFVVPSQGSSGNLSVEVTGSAPVTTATAFTMLQPASYVTKTIGVSWMNFSVDANDKIVFAELYGNGNRVVLKKGTGYTLASNVHVQTLPDAFNPGGLMSIYGSSPIDNGTPITNINDAVHTTVTIKGFDKAKTGYNELKLVMQKFTYAREKYWAGFEINYYQMGVNRNGRNNAAFGNAYLNSLFSGEVEVSSVEIAKSKAEGRYIVRDEVISRIEAYYYSKTSKITDLDMKSSFWRGLFINKESTDNVAVGNNLKGEWVNADNGTLTKMSDKDYQLTFNNIKRGGLGQIVFPDDAIDKVFLRITGFNPDVCGYNELRLFLTDDGLVKGVTNVEFSAKPDVTPSFAFVKNALTNMDNFKCFYLGQFFPHY